MDCSTVFLLSMDALHGRHGDMPPRFPFKEGSAIQLQGVWSADTPAVSIFEVSFSCRVSPAWKSSSSQNRFHPGTEPWGRGGKAVWSQRPSHSVPCWSTLMEKASSRALLISNRKLAEAFSGLLCALFSPSA